LGENILKSYILAIDYKQKKLIYGQKSRFYLPNFDGIVNIIIWFNLLIFIVSLSIIIIKENGLKSKNYK